MTEATYEMMNSGEIQVNLPGGVQVFAKLLDNFPVENVYMSWAQGLIYLRKVRRRDGTIEVRDVTLAAIRYSLARVRRAKDAQANGDRALRRRLRAARLATPKPGAPSPERRKRGPIERVPSPKREAASDAALVYHAPNNLARLAPERNDHQQHAERLGALPRRLDHGQARGPARGQHDARLPGHRRRGRRGARRAQPGAPRL